MRVLGAACGHHGTTLQGNFHDLEGERAGNPPGGELGSLGYLPGQGVFQQRAAGFPNTLAVGEMPGKAQRPWLLAETRARREEQTRWSSSQQQRRSKACPSISIVNQISTGLLCN